MRLSAPSPASLPDERATCMSAGWSWNVTTGEMAWSPEYFGILRLDPRATRPSLAALLDLIHAADRPLVRRAIEQAKAGKQQCCYECRIVRTDQSAARIQIFGHLIPSVAGERLYVGSMLDITASSQAEGAARMARGNRRRAAGSLTARDLAATLVHEINQPLAAIVNDGNACLHWLARKPADLEEAMVSVRSILAEAKRASGIARKLHSLF